MKFSPFRSSLVMLLAVLGSPAQAADELIEIPSRDGVTVKALLTHEPGAKPALVAVLLPGGKGDFHFQAGPAGVQMINEARLPNRLRPLLLERGVASFLVDSPSDKPQLTDEFRGGAEHRADLQAVLAVSAARFPGVPVAVVGHSNGSLSAAPLAAAEPERVAATVLVSGRLVAHPMFGAGLSGFDWDALKMPLLLIHHRKDGCPVTPYRGSAELSAAHPRFTLLSLGRDDATADGGCTYAGTHNLAGEEKAVADGIAGLAAGIARSLR